MTSEKSKEKEKEKTSSFPRSPAHTSFLSSSSSRAHMDTLFGKFTRKKKKEEDTRSRLDDLSIEDEKAAQMNDPEEEIRLKIVFVGYYCTGAKTSFNIRYTKGVYTGNTIATPITEFFAKGVVSRGKKVQLQIWDTPGSERLISIARAYCRGAAGIVVGYDITDRRSFDSLRWWFTKAREMCLDNECTFMIIGNKIDLEERREVSREEGEELARELNSPLFFEGK